MGKQARRVCINYRRLIFRIIQDSNDMVVVDRQDRRVASHITFSDGELQGAGDKTAPAQLTNSVRMPWGSSSIREDIVRIIAQWLSDEGFGSTRQALLEEAGMKLREHDDEQNDRKKLRTSLLGMCSSTNCQRETGLKWKNCAPGHLSRAKRRSCTRFFGNNSWSLLSIANSKRCVLTCPLQAGLYFS